MITTVLLAMTLGVLIWAVLGAREMAQRILAAASATTAATREVRDRLDVEAAHREQRMEMLATQRGIGRELLAQRLAARIAEKKALPKRK